MAAQVPLSSTAPRDALRKLRISVIIPHYNNMEALGETLKGLRDQTTRPLEIFIVENGHSEIKAQIQGLASELDLSANVLFCHERGAGPARNRGARCARGDVLAFLDADCYPAPDWLEKGYAACLETGIVGGNVKVETPLGRVASPEECWDCMFGHDAEKSYRRHSHLLGGNMFIGRKVFASVGEFRNGFAEDREWCERAIAMGFRIGFAPNLSVYHAPLKSYDDISQRWLRMTREEYTRAMGRPHGKIKYCVRSFLVLGSILPHGCKVINARSTHPAGHTLSILKLLARLRWLRFRAAWRLVFDAEAAHRV